MLALRTARGLDLSALKEDTRDAILNVLAESRLGSMASSELRAAVVKEIGCSDRTYERAYADLVRSGDVKKHTIGKKTAKTDGIPTTVEQVAKFQNYNLSTFKFQCSPAWRSCSCWRCSNFARPTGFRHVGEVAFSTLHRSESRTLPDNPPLSENGAKKNRLRAVRGR